MFLATLISDPIFFFLRIISVIMAISVHEFAHAYSAYKFGDNTAKDSGRLTLNPIAHIDVTGLLVMMLLGFGWAKPVLIDPRNLTKNQETMVTAAGPLSNLIVAALAGGLLGLLNIFVTLSGSDLVVIFIQNLVAINIILFLFNLIPLFPLDGSRIFMNLFIPEDNYEFKEKFMRNGPKLLLGLIVLDFLLGGVILSFLLGPLFRFFAELFL